MRGCGARLAKHSPEWQLYPLELWLPAFPFGGGQGGEQLVTSPVVGVAEWHHH